MPCMICDRVAGHTQLTCPERAKGVGMACFVCLEPCTIPEHANEFRLLLKSCYRCDAVGKHWSDECPKPKYDDGMGY